MEGAKMNIKGWIAKLMQSRFPIIGSFDTFAAENIKI
jgi:hypothetical protein